MLYFENLSGVKEDEYLRDGITEDILTDLSKISGLNVFPRTTVLAFRDQKATAADVCRNVRAASLPVTPYLIVLTSRSEPGTSWRRSGPGPTL